MQKLPRLFLSFAVVLFACPALAGILSEHDRPIYRNAFTAARGGNWDLAAQTAREAQDPLLQTALEWLSLSRAGSGRSFADISAFIASHPDWPSQPLLLKRAEEVMIGPSDATLAEWFAHHPPVTPMGRFKEAELWAAAGRKDEAAARIREVWAQAPLTPFDEKAVLERFRDILRTQDHWQRLDRMLWAGDSEGAHRMLHLVDGEHRAVAEARLALAAESSRAERLLAAVPAHLQRDPGLLFERVRWRRRNDMDDAAVEILANAPADLDRPAAWAGERLILARHMLSGGKAQLAYELAARHHLTEGASFAELEFLAGWIALRFLHHPDVAYGHFVHLYDEVKLPVSVARGAYWAGRAADAMTYRHLAHAWYVAGAQHITTFYGQLASAEIGGATPMSLLAEPEPRADGLAAFDRQEFVRVSRGLAEAGAEDFARPFLRQVIEGARSPADFLLAGRLALEVKHPDLAVAAAKRASTQGITLLAEGYPFIALPPGGAIERSLLLAMTRQESAFDREAVSPAGARGLLQLLPATAKTMAKKLDLPFSKARLTTDPEYNLVLGREYLGRMLDGFAGSYVLAIAAYNAGPLRIQQWLASIGDPRTADADVIDWIESIPFTETRTYVQRVLENVQVYRLRLGEEHHAFTLASDLRR